MKKKIERWIARKLKIKPEDVVINKITVNYSYVSPSTMDLVNGVKELDINEI